MGDDGGDALLCAKLFAVAGASVLFLGCKCPPGKERRLTAWTVATSATTDFPGLNTTEKCFYGSEGWRSGGGPPPPDLTGNKIRIVVSCGVAEAAAIKPTWFTSSGGRVPIPVPD